MRVLARRVDAERTGNRADLVGRADDAAHAQRDRAGEGRVARGGARVLAVRDHDGLVVGRRARTRGTAAAGAEDGAANPLVLLAPPIPSANPTPRPDRPTKPANPKVNFRLA